MLNNELIEADTAIVIGDSGAVGALFCRLLLKHYKRVISLDLSFNEDTQLEGIEYIEDDINNSRHVDLLQGARLIILAIPEDAAIDSLDILEQLLKSGQCLIDTMSVKTDIVVRLNKINTGLEIISINPMFGPSLGFNKQSVACIEVNLGPSSAKFLPFIEEAGASVLHFSAEEHDRYTAAIQVATHAAILIFGMTLEKIDYVSDQLQPIWTPPHKILLALLARILTKDSEVYRDIQASNPFAKEIRQDLKISLTELNEIVESGSPEQFKQLFSRLDSVIFNNKNQLSELAQKAFTCD